MFRSIAIAGLAGSLLSFAATPADAGCFGRHHARSAPTGCCQPVQQASCCSSTGGYANYNSGYSSGYSSYSPRYSSGYAGYSGYRGYGVRSTNPYAYNPIQRRAGVGYGSYYGNPYGYGSRYGSSYGNRGVGVNIGLGNSIYGRGLNSFYGTGGGFGNSLYGPGAGFGNSFYGRGGGFGPGVSIGLGGLGF